MPELPEVETVCQGISPFLSQKTIKVVQVYQPRLRLPIPDNLANHCKNKIIIDVSRRGKYIILNLNQGAILIHLGMTGHLRILPKMLCRTKHAHVDIILEDDHVLRYHDPRRFGSWQWVDGPQNKHPSLSHLGKEPLHDGFNGKYLMDACYKKKQPIKSAIMDCRIVVGIGNIYATESLFLSGINPLSPAGNLAFGEYDNLVYQIKEILKKAIIAGGTSLKDFIKPEGKPGYFSQSLFVYGRKNKACLLCGEIIQSITISGRSTAFCPNCQSI